MNLTSLKVGTKALITTDNWFFAPDGLQYRAVYGTVKGVFTDNETLGVKTNARSTNWYAQVGNMVIAGCQIHYVVITEEVNLGHVYDYAVENGEVKRFTTPPRIYDADRGAQ